MKIRKFKIIQGGRDKLEANLAKALFGRDDLEIENQITLLNAFETKKPELKLIKTSEVANTDS